MFDIKAFDDYEVDFS